MSDARVGVLLVGGFLGAGKTTLLQRLMGDPQLGPRLAVLVNELGPLGLDGDLIRGAAESAALRTVQLDNGCICCTLKGSLGAALTELARPATGAPPAAIVVVLSGAALASEVHFQIATQALADVPYFADGLVCVVDAAQAPRWHAREATLFEDQLRRADLVLLSKLDRATPDERAATEALIATIAPRALVVPCPFGDVDPARLFGWGAPQSLDGAHAHTHALAGRTVRFDGPIARAALEALLDDASPALYRIKGRVALAGEPAVVVQCVGEQIDVAPAAADALPPGASADAAPPAASADAAPPAAVGDWSTGDESRFASSRLIFIGRPADVAAWSDPALLRERLGVAVTVVGT